MIYFGHGQDDARLQRLARRRQPFPHLGTHAPLGASASSATVLWRVIGYYLSPDYKQRR